MVVRIELEENYSVTPIAKVASGGDALRPDRVSARDFALPEPSWSLEATALSDYSLSRYSHPAYEMAVSVPTADADIAESWVDSSVISTSVPSDTLVSRLTKGVIGEFESFVSDCSQLGIFTSPFRIGCALRRSDGTHTAYTDITTVLPNTRAPLMLIHEERLVGSTFSCVTEMVNTPCLLKVSMDAFTLPASLAGDVTHLDFFATQQASLLGGDESVTGVRTFQYAGETGPGWLYKRMAEEVVIENAEYDTSFRVIGSLAIGDALEGFSDLRIPTGQKNLENWSRYDTISLDEDSDDEEEDGEGDDAGSGVVVSGGKGDEGDLSEIDYDEFWLETDALDLGLPEERKRVRGVTVRGVFGRILSEEAREITVYLYGSHHRENWHEIGVARGPHLRLLRGVGYRWLKVRIRAWRGDEFDALVFETRG